MGMQPILESPESGVLVGYPDYGLLRGSQVKGNVIPCLLPSSEGLASTSPLSPMNY